MDRNRQDFLSCWTIFCPFTPLWTQKIKISEKWSTHTWRYYLFTNVYHKWQSHDVWLLRYEMQQTEFFILLGYFLPFYPPNNVKNQNFEKLKKMPGNIILHICTINDNLIMYSSWDMKHDRQDFLSFWTTFCPFTPLTNQKIKILKNWKKHLEILSFYTCVT